MVLLVMITIRITITEHLMILHMWRRWQRLLLIIGRVLLRWCLILRILAVVRRAAAIVVVEVMMRWRRRKRLLLLGNVRWIVEAVRRSWRDDVLL